jgi:hypothetical protein
VQIHLLVRQLAGPHSGNLSADEPTTTGLPALEPWCRLNGLRACPENQADPESRGSGISQMILPGAADDKTARRLTAKKMAADDSVFPRGHESLIALRGAGL